WMAVLYCIAGIICFLLIVTIPFGIASFRIAAYAIWPFGRTVVPDPDAGVGAGIGNVIWLILCGWWLALGHLISGIALCLTIIGIPMAIADFKLIPLALWPMGRDIVDADDPRANGAGAVAVSPGR
ncbi:MAG TPA: YccF domain-containing protein, partial [Baekduia sp.]|nr:YccF domain-containing protein [Baekduia sp.]